jgi:Suppressor of fused protein (SUFU)
MFNKLKNLLASEPSSAPATLAEARLSTMVDELGEPDHVDHDSDADQKIDIYAFGRNFVEDCDDDADDDEGYVLITSGMSDRLMTAPAGAEMEETLATELIWYVRDLNAEYFHMLRWLAKLPTIDATWFGSGHRVPMPTPPLSFCTFRTFLLLQPIVSTDRDLYAGLMQQDQPIGTLVVHLVSDAEYALIKSDDEGLNAFFDLLDDNNYPLVFDPNRLSYAD